MSPRYEKKLNNSEIFILPSPIQLKMVRQYEDHVVQQAHDRVFEQNRSEPRYCLPPGMTEDQFRGVVQNLKTIVGDDHVFIEDSLLHFSDPFSPSPKNFPSAAAWYVETILVFSFVLKFININISPNSVEEIREILALANEIHLPLWIASRGKNLGSANLLSLMFLNTY